jgi:hypothetical protein
MKNHIFIFPLAIIFFGSSLQCSAQVSNYIYGIDNPSSGIFYFSKAEIATGVVTELTQVPIFVIGSNNSSCIDADGLIYYFCTGDRLMSFDPVTGSLLSNLLLPLSAGTELLQIQYNPCDSSIYGIMNKTNPLAIHFARYQPANNTLTTISSLPAMGFCMGCQGMLDPDSSIYSFFNGNMIGIALSSGQILYDNPVINYPGETFGHVALLCQTHQVFGTSANGAQSTKYLSIVDPYTGVVTHVAEAGWQAGFIKPAMAGSCIDQANHIFYYGASQLIVGASVLNGSMVYNKSTAPQNLNLIQNFSGCSCHLTGIEENEPDYLFGIFPNPATSSFSISSASLIKAKIEIYNLLGEKIFSAADCRLLTVDCRLFPPGIYFVTLNTEKGTAVQKLIKQ